MFYVVPYPPTTMTLLFATEASRPGRLGHTQWAVYISGVRSSSHRVKPNMAAIEALSYVGFSPPTLSFMFTCYVKTGEFPCGMKWKTIQFIQKNEWLQSITCEKSMITLDNMWKNQWLHSITCEKINEKDFHIRRNNLMLHLKKMALNLTTNKCEQVSYLCYF